MNIILFFIYRQTEYVIELNRLLERNIIQSHVLDLESLCLRAGEKVWCLRVDLHTLNNDGNILDCANIAILCALFSFRLPDTAITDEEITIVSFEI
jgi:exosome complex component RRP45